MNDKRTTEMCGGCGNYDPAQRCIGCLHEFTPAAKPVPEHISDDLTALERLRLHVHDHEIFPFSTEDAEEILEEYEVALTELQHRREAEAGDLRDALTMARAYVEQAVKDDGGIDNCEIGDRLALERIDAALAASPSGVRVKAITWQENGATSIWSGELVFGVYYTIYDEGTGWRVFWRQFLSGAEDTEIAYAAKLDDAKEAAQAHFDAAILSALGEHP